MTEHLPEIAIIQKFEVSHKRKMSDMAGTGRRRTNTTPPTQPEREHLTLEISPNHLFVYVLGLSGRLAKAPAALDEFASRVQTLPLFDPLTHYDTTESA